MKRRITKDDTGHDSIKELAGRISKMPYKDMMKLCRQLQETPVSTGLDGKPETLESAYGATWIAELLSNWSTNVLDKSEDDIFESNSFTVSSKREF